MKKSKAQKWFDRKKRKRAQVPTIKGTITITSGGFGFLRVEAGENDETKPEDVFIPPQYLKGAMDGDEVEATLLEERREQADGRGPAGKIVEIIKRSRDFVVGELISAHKVRPLNKHLPDDIEVSGSLCGAKRGDWVKVSLNFNAETKQSKRGSISETFGKAGEITADIDAIIAEYKLCPPYTAEENEAVMHLTPRDIERQDLRKLFCVAIDPHDAKDVDDAVSIAPGKNDSEVELGVHIADVAAWITPGSAWDKKAYERGFTAYLPSRTLPMLPKLLTKKISLYGGVDSFAHTIIFTVHKHSGRILGARRFHSLINVKANLTYERVQDFIDTGNAKGWTRAFADNLGQLVDLTRIMREYRRVHEKFLDMAIPEIRVVCDESENKIVGLERKLQRESEQLIEECMLAANTEVAGELIRKAMPGLYRVHPEPDPAKLEEFNALMISAFGMNPGDLSSRAACCHFLEDLPDSPRRPVILNAFLRSLPRASYTEAHGLHFGLGKTQYSHFTSPIRRYTDTAVHQQLWNSDCNGRLKSAKTMEKIAESCSNKETNIDDAYYTANDRLKLRYLEEQLQTGGENLHEGMISRIVTGGLLVDILDLGILGFVPIEHLPGKFRRTGEILKADRGHATYKCGDYIYLRLADIDFIRGSAIFRPVN